MDKIELSWGQDFDEEDDDDAEILPVLDENSDDGDDDEDSDDDSSIEIELKLMYKDGFVKLHDIELDVKDLGDDYASIHSLLWNGESGEAISGEVTMHRDNQDSAIFHVDGASSIDQGEASIEFVGYLIATGLIDIDNGASITEPG